MGVYSNYALKESSNVMTNAGSDHILDMVIESAQNDMKMFDSVIELDFMQAYAEAGMITPLTEADEDKAKTSIVKKAKDLFKKLWEKIKQLVSTFVSKIQNVFSNDAKLIKQYSGNLANAVGKKVSNYTPLEDYATAKKNADWTVDTVSSLYKSALEDIERASSKDAVNGAVEGLDGKLTKKFKKDINYNGIFFKDGKKEEEHELTQNDIAIVSNVMAGGGKRLIDLVRANEKEIEKSIKETEKNAKLEKYAAKYTDSSDEEKSLAMSKINATFKVCNKYSAAISKTCNAICNGVSRYIAACRRIFVAAGRAGAVKESAEDKAYEAVLCEASDLYIESALGVA